MNKQNCCRSLMLLILMFLGSWNLIAQQVTVTGTVTEIDGKTPLIGVTVVIKGTTTGAATDVMGKYSLPVKAGEVLVFSYIGYESKEVSFTGNKTINVSLKAQAEKLDEVVVTALGIKREEKALGYAVSKVGAEDLTKTSGHNWLNSMSGKVAGLNFNKAATGPGGSMRVTLRGESSLDLGNGEALFVIDGVPVSSGMEASGSTAYDNTDLPVDFGNGASDLNADDIESVSILKGPAATALYGSRAANGAVVITTKGGKKTKGIGVSISSSVTFEKAGYWPDLQNEYGSGNFGNDRYYAYRKTVNPETGESIAGTQSIYAFGPKFEGQEFYQYDHYDPVTKTFDGKSAWEARDWYKGYWETGVTYTNTIAIQGNNGKGASTRFSFTDVRNDWIMPNTGYTRQSAAFSYNQKVNKYLKLSTKINYYRKDSDNLPMAGYGAASPMYALMMNTPSYDVKWWKDYWREKNVQQNNEVNSNADNPYFVAYEQLNTFDRDRVFGNASLDITINKYLSLTLRTGLDMNMEFRTGRKPWSSVDYPYGTYWEQNIRKVEMNHDFLLKYNRKFLEDRFGFLFSFGGNAMKTEAQNSRQRAERLLNPGVYTLANSQDRVLATSTRTTKAINSFYGMLQLSWMDMYYLDVTGRNDWSSTLAPGYNSYFYPSVSASVVLSEVFKLKDNTTWIDFMKVRGSWAQVGNDTKPYRLKEYYTTTQWGGSFTQPTTVQKYNLKPEMVTSWEVGFEAKFFANRFGFDVAYYNADSRNQILSAPADPMTGYSSTVINAGKITNRGWEVSAYVLPLKTPDWNWRMNFTWSRNRSEVKELAPGIDTWVIHQSIAKRVQIQARVGGSTGDLYGYGFKRAPEGATYVDANGNVQSAAGQIIHDSEGYPLVDKENLKKIGNTQPDWKAGWTNQISWRNLSLSVSVDGQWGGDVYSLSHAILAYSGKLKKTLPGRYDGLIGAGVVQNADGSFSKNRTVTQYGGKYWNQYYIRDNVEANTFSTSFLKLREVRLEYSLPKHWLAKTKVIQGISVAAYGSNLACWTDFPQFDPEVATMDGAQITAGTETGAFPATRTYGFNLKVNF